MKFLKSSFNFFYSFILTLRIVTFVLVTSCLLAFFTPPPETPFFGIFLNDILQALIFFLIFDKDYYAQKNLKNFFLIGFVCIVLSHVVGFVLYQNFH